MHCLIVARRSDKRPIRRPRQCIHTSHIWIVSSLPPDAIYLPSGDHANVISSAAWLPYVWIVSPVAICHTCTPSPRVPEATYRPLGDHATVFTLFIRKDSRCPQYVKILSPRLISLTCTIRSLLPSARYWLSGDHATVPTFFLRS